MVWQLAEAKNNFSEVFTRAIEEGPQVVTRRNQEVVILSGAEYRRLKEEKPNFIEHLLSFPKGEEMDLGRDTRPLRAIDW